MKIQTHQLASFFHRPRQMTAAIAGFSADTRGASDGGTLFADAALSGQRPGPISLHDC